MSLIGKRSEQNFKVASVPGPIANMLQYRSKHDKFCWKCHKKSSTVFCTTCLRSFHTSCASKTFLGVDDLTRSCDQCTNIETSHQKWKIINLDQVKLNSLIGLSLSFSPLCAEFEKVEIVVDHPDIIIPMDYKTIREKLKISQYKSTEEFLSDVRRLQHNCHIVHFNDKQIIDKVNEFFVYCEDEVYDIDLCHECYERKCNDPDKLNSSLCKVPHLALWVKYLDYPYWPAKLLNSVGSKKVEVIFFAQYNTASVSSKNCFLFSKENPNKADDKRNFQEIEDSYKEAMEYTECIKKEFGVYNFPAKCTPYDPQREIEHLKAIIPSFPEPSNNNQTETSVTK